MPDELPWAKRHHLTVVDTPIGPAFAHPCPLLRGTQCGDYADRPRGCRKFHCKLLVRLRENRVSWDTAFIIVSQLRERVASIEAQIPLTGRATLWMLAAHLADTATPESVKTAIRGQFGSLTPEISGLRLEIDDWLMSAEEYRHRPRDDDA